jgi:homoserine kinase type II
MAVFTPVSRDQLESWLARYPVGALASFEGIASGIENSNFFVDTDAGRWVLTLFERLTHEQLPFYLYLMKHLAQGGIPVPDPMSNQDGDILLMPSRNNRIIFFRQKLSFHRRKQRLSLFQNLE